MKPLEGKVAIITGASKGIGRAIADALARAECRCVLAARTEHELEALQKDLSRKGHTAAYANIDVSHDEDLKRLVHVALDKFGTLDFLINNAGWGRKSPVAKADPADWDQTFRVNLRAPMVLSKLVLPTLIEKESGAIINIGSISGRMGQAGSAAYAASKAGLLAFSQSLYEEVREYGIKVAVVLPGFVDTTMIPPVRKLDRTRMILPEDVADAVLYVLNSSSKVCPLEITLRPQRTPYR